VAGYGEITSGKEFQVRGRTFREPEFPTPDGRVRFAVTPAPVFEQAEDELRLMTLRSEGQFNTVVYEDEDLYRGVDRRDALMMAAEDAARLGFAEGDKVRVESETGAMTATVFLVDIRPGNAAMYYPEANILVPPKPEPRSRDPAFQPNPVRPRAGEPGRAPGAGLKEQRGAAAAVEAGRTRSLSSGGRVRSPPAPGPPRSPTAGRAAPPAAGRRRRR